tara:strand:+ start:94 stop:579 length:486 start_codon:yes stop_codon:yes gene_type:complete
MSCKGLKGGELIACKKQAGRVKRDSLKTDRVFKNTVSNRSRRSNFKGVTDSSPTAVARGKKFAKDNNFEGWKEMKKLEGSQDKKNKSTQRTASQKESLTKLYNYTDVYNAKYKSKSPKMKSDSKEMKPHNMYGSGGVVKFVKTMKEHLELKKKGFGHTKKK